MLRIGNKTPSEFNINIGMMIVMTNEIQKIAKTITLLNILF